MNVSEVKMYSSSNSASCPHLATWEVPVKFNGKSRDEYLGQSGPGNDQQCCKTQDDVFRVYNAGTHQCCANGNVKSFQQTC